MLSTLSRLSHFNLQVALAGNIIVLILQRSTEMLSDLPKITKLVILGGPGLVTHTNFQPMLLGLSRGLPGKDKASK